MVQNEVKLLKLYEVEVGDVCVDLSVQKREAAAFDRDVIGRGFCGSMWPV
jgi:hypothetical protein